MSEPADVGPFEPTLGGDRLRRESAAEPEAALVVEAPHAGRLAQIPESNGDSTLTPFESRMADAMAMVLVVLAFLLLVAIGLALLVTVVKYTGGLLGWWR